MPNKTITKIYLIVIFAAFVSLGAAACHKSIVGNGEPPVPSRSLSPYTDPVVTGSIESNLITESSGLVASLCQKDVMWTHNDSGNGPFIFAISPRGKSLGTWRVTDAKNIDWEDLSTFKDSAGNCYLYIGEIGNTKKKEWSEHTIYRLTEPTVGDSDSRSSEKDPKLTGPADALVFSYPDGRHDAETLMVHPESGDIYVISKHSTDPAGVYKIRPDFGSPHKAIAEKISDLTVPAIPNGFLTGGSIAPDGRRMIICDYFGAYEFVLPEQFHNFDEIWKQKPVVVELGKREQGEAISYSADGLSIFATSEGRSAPLIQVKRKQP